MRKSIERKCENCLTCQSRSTAGKKRKVPLHTINGGIRFNKIAAYILGPVTNTKIGSYKYILVLQQICSQQTIAKHNCGGRGMSNRGRVDSSVWGTRFISL